MFLLEWREFPSAPCLAEKKNLMTARVSMLLKSRASLTCFRACFLPGRAKDLSAPQYYTDSIYTVCTRINYKIVLVARMNKYLQYGTSSTVGPVAQSV